MNSPFPLYDTEGKPPTPGVFYKTHLFCKRNFNHKCELHYRNLEANKFINCPYGFSSYKREIHGKLRVFSSLNIHAVSDRKKLKSCLQLKKELKQIDIHNFDELIAWYSNLEAERNIAKNFIKEHEVSASTLDQKKEILDDTLHELRKLNNQLKKQAFLLNKELEKSISDHFVIIDKAKNILSTSQLITVRLNAYDFTLNPEIIETQQKVSISIYRKFEKAKHCLNLMSSDKNVRVNFNGTCHNTIKAYEMFDILPFILIENAIKFSLSGSDINCYFVVENGFLNKIIVTNPSTLPERNEITKLTEKGYRGINTYSKVGGSGKGLYIAKLICDYHDIKLYIETEEYRQKGANGLFKVIIEF